MLILEILRLYVMNRCGSNQEQYKINLETSTISLFLFPQKIKGGRNAFSPYEITLNDNS
jgi:hypothetical protein